MIVYFDLDGVLADFDARVEMLTGKSRKDIDKKEMWEAVNKDPLFFAQLSRMPLCSVFELDYHLLTATGNNYGKVAPQKMFWIEKNLNIPKHQVHIVKSGKDKAAWATPSSILVDDTLEVIEAWEAAGGIGIHYTGNESQVIDKLLLEL